MATQLKTSNKWLVGPGRLAGTHVVSFSGLLGEFQRLLYEAREESAMQRRDDDSAHQLDGGNAKIKLINLQK